MPFCAYVVDPYGVYWSVLLIAACDAAVSALVELCAAAVSAAVGTGGGLGADFPNLLVPIANKHFVTYMILMPGIRAPTVARFLAKFERGPEDSCWEWNANKNGIGYGMIWSAEAGRKVLSHRYSFEHFTGTSPEGAVVQHKCDNPGCVNPKHLELGTMKTNYDDMVNKGRRRIVCNPSNKPPTHYGSECRSAKLNEETAKSARIRMENGTPVRTLARELGLHPKTLRSLRDGETWKHVV